MSILFAANEGEAFSFVGNVYLGSLAKEADLALTRGGIGVRDTSAVLNASLLYSAADFWLTFNVSLENIDDQTDFTIFTLDGSTGALLQIKGVDGVLSFEYNNGAGFTTIGSAAALFEDELHRIDIHCKLHATAGVFEFYLNGVLVESTAPGNTIHTAATTIDSFTLGTPRWGGAVASSAYFSQVIAADEVTLRYTCETIELTGAGDVSDQTGTYVDINEIVVPNDTTLISFALAGDKALFTAAALTPLSATEVIRAVVVNARMSRDAGGPQNARFMLKTNALEYVGDTKALELGLTPQSQIWEVNPNTLVAWNEPGLNSTQWGMEAIA